MSARRAFTFPCSSMSYISNLFFDYWFDWLSISHVTITTYLSACIVFTFPCSSVLYFENESKITHTHTHSLTHTHPHPHTLTQGSSGNCPGWWWCCTQRRWYKNVFSIDRMCSLCIYIHTHTHTGGIKLGDKIVQRMCSLSIEHVLSLYTHTGGIKLGDKIVQRMCSL